MSIRSNIFDDSAYHTFETDINKPDENDQSLEYDQEKTTYHSAIDLIEKSTLPALAPGVYLKIDRYTKCKKLLYGNGYSCQTAVPKKFFIMNDDEQNDEQNADSTWIDRMKNSI